MFQSGYWPTDMKFLTCDEYDGKNSPPRKIDLKTSFMKVWLLINESIFMIIIYGYNFLC